MVATEKIVGLNNVFKDSGITFDSVLSDLDFISFLKKGMKKSALRNIAGKLGIPLSQAVDLLSFPKDDFIDMKEEDLFSAQVTERIIKLAELISRGNEVWENPDKFKVWLNAELPSLKGRKPIEMLNTIIGIEILLDTMGRIEHGVFA